MALLTRTLQQAPGSTKRDKCSYLAAVTRAKVFNRIGFYTQLLGMTVTVDTVNTESSMLEYDYSCGFMTEAELRARADDPDLKLDPGFLDEALERGDRCYGILDGDQLASYGWYGYESPNRFNEELDLVFDPAWVYMYKGYTLPQYRGQKLHAVGMARALAAVTEAGRKGLISCVAAVNGPSLRSCERMGYEIFGCVNICKMINRDGLGPMSEWRISASPGCRPYGFDVVHAQTEPVR